MHSSQEGKRPNQHCLPPPEPYPWLIYFNGKGEKKNQSYQTFYTISDPTKTYPINIPETDAANLLSVQHGWCLLENCTPNNDGSKLFLWNPCNLEKIELPSLKHNDIKDCILSSSPTAIDQVCTIFLFSSSSYSSIFYCQLGDKQWIEVDYREYLLKVSPSAMEDKDSEEELQPYLTNPVYCNGVLYAEPWIGDTLMIIENLGHGLKISSSDVCLPTPMPFSFHQLLESNNELFQIEILDAQDKVMAVVIYRFDFSQMVWRKVESIKDKVFYISDFGSPFACQAVNPETEGGRIYLSLKGNNFVYIYNIEDRTVMISQPFSNLPNKLFRSLWFLPNQRVTDSLIEETGKAQIREKERNDSKETWGTATNACTLSVDTVQVIAKRLNVFDYLHFRATNRLFRSGAPPFQWRSLCDPLQRFDDLSLSPLFVCFDKEDKVLTVVHPKHGLNYIYSMSLPEVFLKPTDCEICSSKDGWLLIAVSTDFSFFFNPFTKQAVLYKYGPKTNRDARWIGFSHPPTSPECTVVEFGKIGPCATMMAHISRLGEDEWGRLHFEDCNFPIYNISPVFHKRAFYYLSKKGKLGVIKVEENISWKELEKPHAPCTDYLNSFLVECNGNLLSVFEGPFGKWVRVFKLNESKMTWIKVKSLENHMLFVGNASFSAMANIPGMENKIYFPRFYGQSIVFYSLETNNYHTFEDDEVVNFHTMREKLNCSWIEPRWH
ncbi:F-box protein [Sesbania bispinosa]|nr:F-box protein [Sesbania bispinosa]